LHPSALTEPDVKLSPHPALTLQRRVSRRVATGRRDSGPVARRAPASASTHALDVETAYGFASGIGSSPCGLTASQGWRVGLLRSTCVTRLPCYYEPVRPCASHRYAHPGGASTWISPFASRRQVPTFHTRACAGLTPFMPVITRAISRRRSHSVPDQRLESGFDDVPTLSTRRQRFTHVRLSSAHLTVHPAFSENAHDPGHWTGAASGGLDPDPAARVREASSHLLCSKLR
jgi:hypothetical protein